MAGTGHPCLKLIPQETFGNFCLYRKAVVGYLAIGTTGAILPSLRTPRKPSSGWFCPAKPQLSSNGAAQSAPETNNPVAAAAEPTETHVTTVEKNDRQVVMAKPEMPISLSLIESSSTHFVQDSIKDFLRKQIDLGEFSIGTATTGIVASFRVPEDLLLPMYTDKLNGFHGFRPGKTYFQIFSNGNEFQQGRLIAFWHPFRQFMPSSLRTARENSLTTITQMQRVEMDINCDSQMQIEIPWVSPSSFYNLVSPGGGLAVSDNIGTLVIYVYSPLKTGTGSNAYSIKIFGHFEDVELVNPTVNTIAVTSEVAARRARRVGQGHMKANVKKKKGKDESHTGPISGPLSVISHVATVAGAIPLLTEVAAPVAWLTALGAKAAAAFGYSAPRVNELMVSQARAILPQFGNSDHPVQNVKAVALSAANQVPWVAFAGTAEDEMAMLYLIRKKAYVGSFSWTTSDLQGQDLKDWVLAPFTWEIVQGTGPSGTNIYAAPPVAYLANLFAYYRGSFEMTFKFVKTMQHQGRLVVAFYPGLTAAGPTLEDSAFVHRHIIDISEGNEFTLKFPYTYQTAFVNTEVPYGVMSIYVLNELTAPSTCSSTIDVLMEVSGAEDFEFAFPRTKQISPFIDQGFADPLPAPRAKKIGSGHMNTEACKITPPVGVGNARISSQSSNPAAMCIGEKVTSIRQLLQTFIQAQIISTGTNSRITVRPSVPGIMSASAGVFAGSDLAEDYWSLLAPMYAFWRGGMRLFFTTLATSTNVPNLGTQTTAAWLDSTAVSDAVTYPANSLTPQLGRMQIDGRSMNGGILIESPQYGRVPFFLVRPNYRTTLGGAAVKSTNDLYASQTAVTCIDTGTSLQIAVFRAIADDTQLGGFVCVLPYVKDIPMSAIVPEQREVSFSSPHPVLAADVPSAPKSTVTSGPPANPGAARNWFVH